MSELNKAVQAPIDPTDEMISAVEGLEFSFGSGDEDWTGIISEDIAREVYRLMIEARPCSVPPEGWQCSRTAGHEGPCAAIRKATS